METMMMATSQTQSPVTSELRIYNSSIYPPLRKQTATPPISERQERTSFASFKEDRSTIAQSFIDSKLSCHASTCEEAIYDSDFEEDNSETDEYQSHPLDTTMDLTNPYSMLNAFVCPREGFRAWKQIAVSGRAAGKSFSDLKFLSTGFAWESCFSKQSKGTKPKIVAGQSFLENLPVELLDNIVDQLVTDLPPIGFQPRNMDLMSLLLTSRAMHAVTLATIYRQVTIPHSKIFRKFLAQVAAHPALGTMVRRLDFSHFNPTGAGMTARERAAAKTLTDKTLIQCLELLPHIREFLAQEHIDEDLSADVIRKLFEMPRLQALDFCASSSKPFRDAMMTVFRSTGSLDLPQVMPITRLSFHECQIIPSAIFESLLPRLPYLTHLDVTHTRITDKALTLIPRSARLTHLNLSKCSSLSGKDVVEFLATHPAVKDTLVYLNLLMDAKSHEMLDEDNNTALIPRLPRTLKSLNLKGSKMAHGHLDLLLPLTKHLEELVVGRNLPYEDVASLLVPSSDGGEASEPWIPHTLRYLDISDFEVNQLDFGLFLGSQTSILLPGTLPLEVIEVGTKAFDLLKERKFVCEHFGWVAKEAGRRGWLVRDMTKIKSKKMDASGGQYDDGARSWKMGATSWGMRKVPVAHAEVGGMYGLYMFKR